MQPFLLHTHFYQPERANPWTGTLDPEPDAAPFRDWNERIHTESYRALAFARIYDADGLVERIVNTYEWLSFNFGPTLLAWLSLHHPGTYARVLEADGKGLARTGHGNALAQAFHHTILPLDTERDRRTQIRWGVADFRHRFRREPEGMWLPETAANQAVIDALIDEGIAFTVLAPRQAERIREAGGTWQHADGALDPSRPYRVSHSDGSGRHLAAFFYDGALAHRFAFDPDAMESKVMLDSLAGGARGGLVHAALDGETFGHHRRFGELGLAYTLAGAAEQRGLEPTNYGAYLAAYPPTAEATVVGGEGSSWSCAHGVGRWQRDCGCSTSAEGEWNQAWRRPLRAALDIVRDAAAAAFEERGGELMSDPWAARDAYVDVLVGATDPATFLRVDAGRSASEDPQRDVWSLLEAQRNALAMYTSCGWFFADVSGIETVYVMRFAARALELLEEVGVRVPRSDVLDRLGEARSNRAHVGTGADVWKERVEPYAVSPARVAAQVGLAAAAGLDPGTGADGHDVRIARLRSARADTMTLATAAATVTVRATGRSAAFAVAGFGLGGLDVQARAAPLDAADPEALDDLARRLHVMPVEEVSRELDHLLGGAVFTLDDALPSYRAQLLAAERVAAVAGLRRELAGAYSRYAHRLDVLRAAGTSPPAEVRALEGAQAAHELETLVGSLPDLPPRFTERIAILRGALEAGHTLELVRLREALTAAVTTAVRRVLAAPAGDVLEDLLALMDAATALDLAIDLSMAQEEAYDALLARRGSATDAEAEVLARLGGILRLRWPDGQEP